MIKLNRMVIYIHGKGGNAGEADHYKALFENQDVVGLDYQAETPWEAAKEFPGLLDALCGDCESVTLVASSIGAYFAMTALDGRKIEKAFFISPIVDMEKLITNMMLWAGVTEEELKEKGEIPTDFGETLSWEYLCWVREHPVFWNVPTHILYGEKDDLTSCETVSNFARNHGATLTVMENGEHWFHTGEQMAFLDGWIRNH